MPVNKLVRIGIWEDAKFIGATIFSCGSAGAGSTGKRLGLNNTEVAELARVALTDHKTPVTRIVSIALMMLKNAQNGLRLIVSYADPEHGHIGAIYQAGNWCYVGRSSPDTAYVDTNGKRWHSRSVSETGMKVHCGQKVRCPRPSTMTAIDVIPKYKYLMPLDDAMRKQIEPLRQPYPKRSGVASIANDATAIHAAEGGATPTATLQTTEAVYA
jgi:hypothetical protein